MNAAVLQAWAIPGCIDYLQKLGVTAIEILPVHAFLQDRFLVSHDLANYWGYSTLSYFAPEPAYLSASDGSLHEIPQTVRRLHEAGIELILDVVYNHTCEGSELGPTLSWRGFDNLSYYRPVEGNTVIWSTIPAAAIRSTSPIRACCKWSWIRCAIGPRPIMSMVSASILAPRSAARPMVSIPAPVFSTPSARTPCSRA